MYRGGSDHTQPMETKPEIKEDSMTRHRVRGSQYLYIGYYKLP